MKNKITVLLGLAAASLLTQGTQADPITGNISFGGSATLNAPLASATSASDIHATVTPGLQSGSYSSVPDSTAVTFNNFSWATIPLPSAINPLWTFTVGLWTYSFELDTLKVNTQTAAFLNLQGTGKETITGLLSPYTTTEGSWTFTIDNSNPGSSDVKFGFASETSTVPDGGATVALLGSAMVGLGVLRRKLSA